MAGRDMESNARVALNWGTFNIPTIVAVATVGWYTATKQERQDARLDAIEINRAARSAEVNKMLEAMSIKVSPLENVTYRVTVLEQGVADVNRRVDRVADSMQGIREDIGAVSTKIEVLTNQLQQLLPGQQRANLNEPPKALSRTP